MKLGYIARPLEGKWGQASTGVARDIRIRPVNTYGSGELHIEFLYFLGQLWTLWMPHRLRQIILEALKGLKGLIDLYSCCALLGKLSSWNQAETGSSVTYVAMVDDSRPAF